MYQVLKIYRNDFSYPKLPRRDYKEISCRDTNTPLKHEYQHYINMFNIKVRNDSKMLLLGLIQSLFEGSMYTFVLLWYAIAIILHVLLL